MNQRHQRRTEPRGKALIADPVRNRGTAFTTVEREQLGLTGLLPFDVETIEEQLARVREKFDAAETAIDKHIVLRGQQDSNETLFYAFLRHNLAETMPIVYTPTVGEACQRFSHIYRHPRGLFLAYPDRVRLDQILDGIDEPVRAIVVTDGERILGLGDQGIGGMGIPVGKLSLYTACAGIRPEATLPIILDVGTNNPDLLADPLYMGWRHERIGDDDYHRFVDVFVAAVARRFPGALLQWEDFAMRHATTLLERHRESILSFNDDIQGTAAVSLAAVHGAMRVTGSRLIDQRFVFAGAGSAGTGIASMVVDALAAAGAPSPQDQVFLVDNLGLLHDARKDLAPYQAALACRRNSTADWTGGTLDLAAVVSNVKPTVLIGVSGQPGLFTRSIVEAMTAWAEHPIIFPLSNPTDRAEATPTDLLHWTGGSAIVATGSPFEPVEVEHTITRIPQANNVYIFPGLALGALAVNASKITDSMLHAAASAVAAAAQTPGEILPPIENIVAVSRRVAIAVAEAAVADGVASPAPGPVGDRIDDMAWTPSYSQPAGSP